MATSYLTLIASALRNEIKPFYYIRDLLEKLQTWDPDRPDELLPDRWTPNSPVPE